VESLRERLCQSAGPLLEKLIFLKLGDCEWGQDITTTPGIVVSPATHLIGQNACNATDPNLDLLAETVLAEQQQHYH
jgi:hypothetical protein